MAKLSHLAEEHSLSMAMTPVSMVDIVSRQLILVTHSKVKYKAPDALFEMMAHLCISVAFGVVFLQDAEPSSRRMA